MEIAANPITINFIDIAHIGDINRTVQCYDQDLLSSIINRYKLQAKINSIENIIFLYNGKTLVPTLKAFEVGITKNANVYVLTKEQYKKNLINVFIKNENNSIKIRCLTYEKVNDIIERYRNISGFNTVMRLHRPHVRAFAAGSVIVIEAKGKSFDNVMNLGERQNEGFGKVRVFDAEKFLNEPLVLKASESSCEMQKTQISKLHNDIQKREQMRMAAIKYANDNKSTILDMNASSWGCL